MLSIHSSSDLEALRDEVPHDRPGVLAEALDAQRVADLGAGMLNRLGKFGQSLPNFRRLVLGYVEADFCDQRNSCCSMFEDQFGQKLAEGC